MAPVQAAATAFIILPSARQAQALCALLEVVPASISCPRVRGSPAAKSDCRNTIVRGWEARNTKRNKTVAYLRSAIYYVQLGGCA
jgi:hypothetical protein